MERRKFITGLGALATGSAAAMGTGAMSSVEADREVSINTAGDAFAYLRLKGDDEYINNDNGGELSIDLGNPNTNEGGKGFNDNATTYVHSVITVENQGNKTVRAGFPDPDNDDNSLRETTLSMSDADVMFKFHGVRDLEPGDDVHIDVEVDTSESGGSEDTLTIAADEEWDDS